MKNFSQVGEILVHNKQQHEELALYYSTLAMSCADQRTAMLLTTLADHEKQLAHELVRYLDEADNCIIETYFQFDHEQQLASLMTVRPGVPISTADVIALATAIDDYFIAFYQELFSAAENDKIRDLFENLSEHLTEEKRRLSTDVYMLHDM